MVIKQELINFLKLKLTRVCISHVSNNETSFNRRLKHVFYIVFSAKCNFKVWFGVERLVWFVVFAISSRHLLLITISTVSYEREVKIKITLYYSS